MPENKQLKFLFILNKQSGKDDVDWKQEITQHFKESMHEINFFELPEDCTIEGIKKEIDQKHPHRVIAVGGDGTVKLVAECIMDKNIALGILPGGSANGMAKELGVEKKEEAPRTITKGATKQIHLVKVNDEICIHLSDIGFNAFMIKEFEKEDARGMWGYVKAACSVFLKRRHMHINMEIDNKEISRKAVMVVIANATKYGTGALINPLGTLEDDKFEAIIIKKFSLPELFKMVVTHQPYHPAKTEVLQTKHLKIDAREPIHFQVDGEYLGKINKMEASILPGALTVLVPAG